MRSNAKKTPSRREMFQVGLTGLAVVATAGSVPAFLSRFAFAEPATAPAISNDNILVVIQWTGGNDGLNTVVPVGDDTYLKARPKIALKERMHRLNDAYALNPGLIEFKSLFDQGRMAIINGCGYPEPNRSHFRSMEIWHTAEPKGYEPRGWLGHYLDHVARGTDHSMQAMNIGPELPQALVTDSAPVPSIESIQDFQVRTDPATPFDAALEQRLISDLNAVREASPALQFLSRQATNAIVSAQNVQKMAAGYKPDAEYPGQGLGPQLRTIAQCIAAGLATRLFYAQVGGFDTHANQVNGHEQLLAQVGRAVGAFQKDMSAKGFADKIIMMCFSEFGRRVTQNDSNGTDHGAAGPMFVIGGKVKGGLYGAYPSLTDLVGGDLKYTTDFRQVYATLLDRWLKADSQKVLRAKFEPVAFL